MPLSIRGWGFSASDKAVSRPLGPLATALSIILRVSVRFMESPLFLSGLLTGQEPRLGETGKGMARKDDVAPPLPGPLPLLRRGRGRRHQPNGRFI